MATPLSKSFYPEATDASIRAAITAAAALGGATIYLPDGGVDGITLLSPLPASPGVRLVGTPLEFAFPSSVPDSDFNFVGGTWFKGDGTFPCFAANDTARGSPHAAFADDAVGNFSLENVGIQAFSDGIRIGATNVMGLMFSRLLDIWIKDCTGWGVNLVNWMHLDASRIYTHNCFHAQRYAMDVAEGVLQPGNSRFHTIFNSHGTANRLTSRGLVFEAMAGAVLNQFYGDRIQNNRFGGAELVVTGNVTSGSANITVPDGSQFAVGMPFIFNSTSNGFTGQITKFVSSIVGNVITVAAGKPGYGSTWADEVATGTGTVQIRSNGFPNLEIITVVNSEFLGLDLEGRSTASVLLQGTRNCNFSMQYVNSGSAVHSHMVLRDARTGRIECNNTSAITDFDVTSADTHYYGSRAQIRAYTGIGIWKDGNRTSLSVLNLRNNSTLNRGDFEVRGSNRFLQPSLIGIGKNIVPNDSTSMTLTPASSVWVFAGAAAATWALPTITNADDYSSMVGAEFSVVNAGTANLTLNTDGTQLFNRVTGKISYTLTPGQSIQVYAARTASNALFYAAFPGNGVS